MSPCGLYCCDKDYDQKQAGGGGGCKGLFDLHILVKGHGKKPKLENQGRKLEVEIEAKAIEEC